MTRRPFHVLSACGRYRYVLAWPTGLDNGRAALGVFANPSTATASDKDRTLTRWIGYCKRWGYGWAMIGNVRAWRETHPELVPADPLAIGPENAEYLRQMALHSELIVCGWGKLGGAQAPETLRILRASGRIPHALTLNADGSPGHPLFLRADLRPFPI